MRLPLIKSIFNIYTLYCTAIFKLLPYYRECSLVLLYNYKVNAFLMVKDNKKDKNHIKLCEICEYLHGTKTKQMSLLEMRYMAIIHLNESKTREKCTLTSKKNNELLYNLYKKKLVSTLTRYTRCFICYKNNKKPDKSFICNLLNNRHYHIICLYKKFTKAIEDNELLRNLISMNDNLVDLKAEITCLLENIQVKHLIEPQFSKRVINILSKNEADINKIRYENMKEKLNEILFIIRLKLALNNDLSKRYNSWDKKNFKINSYHNYIKLDNLFRLFSKVNEPLYRSFRQLKYINIDLKNLIDIECIYIDDEILYVYDFDEINLLYNIKTSIYLVVKDISRNKIIYNLKKLSFDIVSLHYNFSEIIPTSNNINIIQYLYLIMYMDPHKLILESLDFHILKLYLSEYIRQAKKLNEIILIYNNTNFDHINEKSYDEFKVYSNINNVKNLTIEIKSDISDKDFRYILYMANKFTSLEKLSIIIETSNKNIPENIDKDKLNQNIPENIDKDKLNQNIPKNIDKDKLNQNIPKNIDKDKLNQNKLNLKFLNLTFNDLELNFRIQEHVNNFISYSKRELIYEYLLYTKIFWYKDTNKYIDWIINSKNQYKIKKIISDNKIIDFEFLNKFLEKCPYLQEIEFKNLNSNRKRFIKESTKDLHTVNIIVISNVTWSDFVEIIGTFHIKKLIIKNLIITEEEFQTFKKISIVYISEVHYIIPKINGIFLRNTEFEDFLNKILLTHKFNNITDSNNI